MLCQWGMPAYLPGNTNPARRTESARSRLASGEGGGGLHAGFGLAALASVSFPSGDRASFLSDGAVTAVSEGHLDGP